ncbi:MAG: putative universal stress protein [Syntrophomonadaceae bacterium]|nr:putative universal stress protein [Bacillota bacterium]
MGEAIKKIILCFDNSNSSIVASEISLSLARSFGSEVVGIHGYNAFMHEGAFRIMEPTLPQQYQKEEILQKQREVHNTLINVGMEKISLSYLKPLEDAFRAAGVNFRQRVKEGKNFKVLNEILSEEEGDVVVIGSSGFNSNGRGFVGSVCLRVLRNNDRNFLVEKKPISFKNPRFVIGLDGSSSAIAALRMAKLFADKYNAELHLIYVFDSALHKEVFGRLKESLINKEGFSFNSKEQEKIHDEFINKGLARVGNMILDKAEKAVFSESGRGETGKIGIKRVLEGHIYKRICDYASEVNADMIFVGRTGRHFAEGIDIGSVAENVVRFSPCSVFVAESQEYKGWEL